jgi:hypothetical protein
MQRATQTFVTLTEGYRVVRKGDELEEDDPIVVENSGLFEPCVHAHIPTDSGGPTTVEQATAAPGEKRKR